jgi:hypothetical protein
MKAKFCKHSGITLITVPFWWDRRVESLAATIQKYRPDIELNVSSKEPAILFEMPEKYQKPFKYKPNIPTEYHQRVDPCDW